MVLVHFSDEIFHVTTVLNELSLAAIFLHIVDLAGWIEIAKKVNNSKADTLEAQTWLSLARKLGPKYEQKAKLAILSDSKNKLSYIPHLTALTTFFAMFLTSTKIEAFEENPYLSREWFVLILSITTFALSLFCVYFHQKNKVSDTKTVVVDNFSPPNVS